MELTKEDFFKKYSDTNISFDNENIIIKNLQDWNKIIEIQKYVLSSDNCYFIELDYNVLHIRLEANLTRIKK